MFPGDEADELIFMRRTGLAVAILLAALALYGCGGGEKNPAPADNGSTQTTKTGRYGY